MAFNRIVLTEKRLLFSKIFSEEEMVINGNLLVGNNFAIIERSFKDNEIEWLRCVSVPSGIEDIINTHRLAIKRSTNFSPIAHIPNVLASNKRVYGQPDGISYPDGWLKSQYEKNKDRIIAHHIEECVRVRNIVIKIAKMRPSEEHSTSILAPEHQQWLVNARTSMEFHGWDDDF